MPEFLNPFTGMAPGRKLTRSELARTLRLAIAAEEEAVHLYEAIADATDHDLARKVLHDIANEERVHVGEFQKLLNLLLPDEEGYLAEGAAEVEEMIEEDPAEAPSGSSDEGSLTVGDLKE